MVQFKSIIYVSAVLFAVILAGCIGGEETKQTPTPVPTPAPAPTWQPGISDVVTPTSIAEVTPTGNRVPVRLDSRRGFIPPTQTIVLGDEIVWSNDEVETVTLISSDGLFDARVLSQGKQYSFIFKKTGTYTFYLEKNKNQNGTVIVKSFEVPKPTPVATVTKQLPPGALYVVARMLNPVDWGNGKFELTSLKVQIFNQRNNPLTIRAQVLSGGEILEEKSVILEREGSSVEFTNEKRHFINNTNVTLRLIPQGYEPLEYRFTEVDVLN